MREFIIVMKKCLGEYYYFVLIIVLLLFCCSCSIFESMSPQGYEEYVLELGRPEGATNTPDFSGEITDIRFTVKERTFEATVNKEYFENKTMLQIYYGYCLDGVWYDIPAENYDLKGVFALRNDNGWKAVAQGHIVEIGPYVVISAVGYAHPNASHKFYDSIGSEIQEPFAEYVSYFAYGDETGIIYSDSQSSGYGLFYENRQSVVDGKLEFDALSSFDHRYYIVIKYDDIPDDYRVHFNSDHGKRYLLTKKGIDKILGK